VVRIGISPGVTDWCQVPVGEKGVGQVVNQAGSTGPEIDAVAVDATGSTVRRRDGEVGIAVSLLSLGVAMVLVARVELY